MRKRHLKKNISILTILVISFTLIIVFLVDKEETETFETLSVSEIHNYFNSNTYYNADLTSLHAIAKKKGDPQILFDKEADARFAPASLTKLMTVLVALDYVEDWQALAPIDTDSFNYLYSENSSMVGFLPGEQTTFLDLLYGTLLSSGGEATMSLAINAVGSEQEMVYLMNKKANDLNLLNTHFTNLIGFDADEHYSSARDIAVIIEHLLNDNLIKEVLSTRSIMTTTPSHPEGILMTSTVLQGVINDPNRSYTIKGGKSGRTLNAGLNWGTYGLIDDEEYIVVVMGAPWNQELKQIEDTHKVFNLLALNRFR